MNEQQFMLLISVMWIAPHMHKDYALLIGLLSLVLACVKGML